MEIKRIAHRGFSSEAPENSYISFALAAEGDFYGIECDVWKSKDGVFVVSHDGNMERMYGIDAYIPDMTYDELKNYPLVRGRKRLLHPQQYLLPLTGYLSILQRAQRKMAVVELV